MALTQARLPAPLRLKPAAISPLSTSDAHSSIQSFLDISAANDLLAGSGVVRSALLRLVAGLKEELEAGPLPSTTTIAASKVEEGGADKTKKRRKSEGGKGADGEGKKKKRKVEAER